MYQDSEKQVPPCEAASFSRLCLEFMSYCAELSLVDAQEAELAWGRKVNEFWELKFGLDAQINQVDRGELSDEIFRAHQEWRGNISGISLGKELHIAKALLEKYSITKK